MGNFWKFILYIELDIRMLGKRSTKRNKILKTSLELFRNQGFNRVGVDLIIETANVAKMTFYKYFPSKMNLIETCLEEESQRIQHAIVVSFKQDAQMTPLHNLRAFYLWHIENKGCLFARVAYEIKPTPAMLDIIQHHKIWKYHVIQQQLWEMGQAENDMLIDLLYTMFEGLLIPVEQPIDQVTMWQMIKNLLKP